MSSIGVCSLLPRAGYSTILQISCRDRNRIAIQGEIPGVSGAHIMAYRQEHSVAEIIETTGVLDGRMPWYPGRDDPEKLNPESPDALLRKVEGIMG